MPADLQKARELFLHAVGKLPPERWDAYLAESCGGDAELERQVAHLLRVHQEAGSFLDRPAGGVAATGAFAPAPEDAAAVPTEAAGTAIGPYKLIQAIGEGGMGTVWMAQQTAPVKRLVALKVIKPGMDSKQVLARFEAERQALALMDHPNIARVLDAGATAAGRPYFVMELVKGVPITRYCDEHRLTPRQRLELFVPVCQAIQHAHQKGVIHRDLKPSNVLVALYDRRPVPKVIDFGIAKAAGQQLTEHTLVTGFGAVVGTLEYMSPEQAELNQLDIDTRSDVYSLGVLLYELLTGSTPLEKKRLKEAALLEVLRVIREEDPPRPSTRLSTTDELPSVAANRGLEPRQLSGLGAGRRERGPGRGARGPRRAGRRPRGAGSPAGAHRPRVERGARGGGRAPRQGAGRPPRRLGPLGPAAGGAGAGGGAGAEWPRRPRPGRAGAGPACGDKAGGGRPAHGGPP
jgi:serine/threonine protein kinase